MHEDVRHRGVWFPADYQSDTATDTRMVRWIADHVPNLSNRVILTPRMTDPVAEHPVLALLTKGAPRRSERGGADWQWCSGPVILGWPNENTLFDAVPMATDQTIVVFEWSTPCLGWASATEAFNAATGETTPPLSDELHEEFSGMFFWSNELCGGALKGRDRDRPQRHLRNLHEAGLDEAFVLTYAMALNEFVDPKHIRDHYRAATGQTRPARYRHR